MTAWHWVAAEFTGFEEQTGPLWLPKDSDRIWRGSYKGRDWRYLVPLPACCYGCLGAASGSDRRLRCFMQVEAIKQVA